MQTKPQLKYLQNSRLQGKRSYLVKYNIICKSSKSIITTAVSPFLSLFLLSLQCHTITSMWAPPSCRCGPMSMPPSVALWWPSAPPLGSRWLCSAPCFPCHVSSMPWPRMAWFSGEVIRVTYWSSQFSYLFSFFPPGNCRICGNAQMCRDWRQLEVGWLPLWWHSPCAWTFSSRWCRLARCWPTLWSRLVCSCCAISRTVRRWWSCCRRNCEHHWHLAPPPIRIRDPRSCWSPRSWPSNEWRAACPIQTIRSLTTVLRAIWVDVMISFLYRIVRRTSSMAASMEHPLDPPVRRPLSIQWASIS